MMKFRIIFSFAIIFVAFACSSSKSSVSYSKPTTSSSTSRSLVHFERSNSMSTVLDKAKSSNKPIFVDFYTSWCAPCKLMDKDVFTHPATAELLNRNFVNYKINAEHGNGPDMATLYNVTSFPTLLFLDENGKVLLRHVGAAYQETMKDITRIALDKNKSMAGGR